MARGQRRQRMQHAPGVLVCQAAVVAVGGILGIGAKKVLIPASDIERTDDGRLIVAMVSAKWPAPPSARSSRSTEVSTT